jgi:hypothetical protein
MPVEGKGSRSGECCPRSPANPCLNSYLKNVLHWGSIRIGTLQSWFGAYGTGSGLIAHRAETERQRVYDE